MEKKGKKEKEICLTAKVPKGTQPQIAMNVVAAKAVYAAYAAWDKTHPLGCSFSWVERKGKAIKCAIKPFWHAEHW